MKRLPRVRTIDDWIKYAFEGIGLPEFISWEDFKEKQYYVFPVLRIGKKTRPA